MRVCTGAGARASGVARAATALACAWMLLLASAVTALAEPPRSGIPSGLTQQVTSSHFVVHYTTTGGDPNATTDQAAQQLAMSAEQALGDETSQLGFPPPLDDGDGHTDIYVFADPRYDASARPDYGSAQTSAWIQVGPQFVSDPGVIYHELFHVLQLAVYSFEASWLKEATASWAATNFVPGITGATPAAAGASLDCTAATCGNTSETKGYGEWMFFEYLYERFGSPTLIYEIWQRAAALGAGNNQQHALQALDDVLGTHGSSLAQAWIDYARFNLSEGYTRSPLRGTDDVWAYAGGRVTSVQLGLPFAPLPTQTVTINHLASGYVELVTAGKFGGACTAETLHVVVTPPAALTNEVIYRELVLPSGSMPAAAVLPVSGGRGALDLPWSDCGDRHLVIGMANPSATTDGQILAVSASLTSPPPVITAHVARRVTLSSRSRKLTLHISSSGIGRLVAVMHSAGVRKVFALQAGANTLRWRLPRSIHAGRHRLTLTPQSGGGQPGSALHRSVTIAFKR